MPRTLEAPETINSGSSSYLESNADNVGLYLMIVKEAHEDKRPTKNGLENFDGFSLECEVVGGPNEGKNFNLLLGDPKRSHKDEGKSAAAKQAAFLIATDVIKPTDLGKSISYDPASAIGSFFVIDLVLGKKSDDGKQYLELNYSNVYHVDDPRAKKLKLNADQSARIAKIKEAYRHKEDYFAPLVAKKESPKAETKADFSDL